MGRADRESSEEGRDSAVDLADILTQLGELEETITTPEQHRELRQTKHLLERVPGGELLEESIEKYTTRDIGEAFVGSIIFALPMLVESGVFEIAEHFVTFFVGGVPILLVGHIIFVIALTTGLIYAVDFREVKIVNPIFGIFPRRLVGVLVISLLTSSILMVMWGRTAAEDPTTLAVVARISIVWGAAALGASLGDILPGESKGTDLTLTNLDELIDTDGSKTETDR